MSTLVWSKVSMVPAAYVPWEYRGLPRTAESPAPRGALVRWVTQSADRQASGNHNGFGVSCGNGEYANLGGVVEVVSVWMGERMQQIEAVVGDTT